MHIVPATTDDVLGGWRIRRALGVDDGKAEQRVWAWLALRGLPILATAVLVSPRSNIRDLDIVPTIAIFAHLFDVIPASTSLAIPGHVSP